MAVHLEAHLFVQVAINHRTGTFGTHLTSSGHKTISSIARLWWDESTQPPFLSKSEVSVASGGKRKKTQLVRWPLILR